MEVQTSEMRRGPRPPKGRVGARWVVGIHSKEKGETSEHVLRADR